MPTIVDYQTVLSTLIGSGLNCNYHNSGSFGIDDPSAPTVGWLAESDPSIRQEMMAFAQIIPPPALPKLLDAIRQVWLDQLPGNIWIMPASHWAFELHYGNAEWLPQRLQSIGLDVSQLQNRNDGSAISFSKYECDPLNLLVGDLLTRSIGSDFTAAFPGHATVAMLHHHQQVWWRTNNVTLAAALQTV